MSKCEWFGLVSQDKWANCWVFFEQIAHFSLSLSKSEQFAKKNSKKSYFGSFLQFFEVFKKKQKIHSFLLNKESESLMLLRRKERSWANCSGRSPKMSEWANHSLFEQITYSFTFLANNEWFAPKVNKQIPNPDKKWRSLAKNFIFWLLFFVSLSLTGFLLPDYVSNHNRVKN